MQSFTAGMPLLMATSTFGLGRRRWSSLQQLLSPYLLSPYRIPIGMINNAVSVGSQLPNM